MNMHLLAFPVGAAVAALLYLEGTRALYPLLSYLPLSSSKPDFRQVEHKITY